MKDCRRFLDLQEAYAQVQKPAVEQGYPAVPGQLALNAPPPPPGAPPAPAAQPNAGAIAPYDRPRGQLNMVHRVARESSPPELEPYPKSRGSICMIQKGRVTNRKQRLISRQVYLATTAPPATPEYHNWSEQDIAFHRGDHPPQVPRPGHAALVLEA